MTTNVATEPATDILSGLVETAVAALGVAVDATLSAGPAVAVDGVPADVVALRAEITAPGGAGGLVVVLEEESLALTDGDPTDAAAVAAALAEGFAAGLTAAKGTPHQSGSPAPVDDVDGPQLVRFEIGSETGASFPIHWVVEASLGSIVAEGVPVTPSPAADPSVAPAAFPELNESAGFGPAQDLALLSDVPMNVTVELGRSVMQVRELLTLKEGSIVELDRDAGAAVDVLVNGTLVARGDVVVIDDDLGVRITEIIDR